MNFNVSLGKNLLNGYFKDDGQGIKFMDSYVNWINIQKLASYTQGMERTYI
jgi:hypothetical protein